MILRSVEEAIGNTPLIHLTSMAVTSGCTVLGKLEALNPSGSVKARLARALLDDADRRGVLSTDTVVVEPTSGNTGIGLAMLCARRGLSLILTMPESMSLERRQLLSALGARLELTPAEKGMQGAVDRALELVAQIPHAWMPDQFSNPANAAYHEAHTAQEILRDTGGSVDALVAGIGTGGTVTGVGRALKKHSSGIYIAGFEPAGSPVISGGNSGPHGIQGIGAGFVPQVLDRSILDEVLTVTDDEARDAARRLAGTEGLFCGISSGAAVAAALKLTRRHEMKGKTLVVILPDTGDRYLSTSLWEKS